MRCGHLQICRSKQLWHHQSLAAGADEMQLNCGV